MDKGRPRRMVLRDPLRTELAALKRKNAALEAENAELLAKKERLVENNAELRTALAEAQATGALAVERAARAGVGPNAARVVVTEELYPLLEKHQSILTSLRNRQSQGGAMTRTERAVVDLADALADTADRFERFVAQWQADDAYTNEVVARYLRSGQEIEPAYIEMLLTESHKREQEERWREQEERERWQADTEREATAQALRVQGAEESAKTRRAKAGERKRQLIARGLELLGGVPERRRTVKRVAEAMASDSKCQQLAPRRGRAAKDRWKSWMPIASLVLKEE